MDDRSTLAQALLKTLGQATGWETIHNLIGAGQYASKYGLPESVSLSGNRLILRDPDIQDAEAFGSSIMGVPRGLSPDEEKATTIHEGRHLGQADVLGPAMLLAKPAEMLFDYGRGPLERDALRHEQPTTELVRQKPGLYTALLEKYFRGTLGD
jgi:hypothetical protein